LKNPSFYFLKGPIYSLQFSEGAYLEAYYLTNDQLKLVTWQAFDSFAT
jgi:hypothetical protein